MIPNDPRPRIRTLKILTAVIHPKVPRTGSVETCCNVLESTGMHQNALECNGMHQNVQECTRMHWNALEFNRIHQNALECARTHWNELECTGMHNAPPSIVHRCSLQESSQGLLFTSLFVLVTYNSTLTKSIRLQKKALITQITIKFKVYYPKGCYWAYILMIKAG